MEILSVVVQVFIAYKILYIIVWIFTHWGEKTPTSEETKAYNEWLLRAQEKEQKEQ